MPQTPVVVGIDISKMKADVCLRAQHARLSVPSTAEGRARLLAWIGQHRVELAVMEASGGYERSWAQALRRAGVAVAVVDPKRVRYFARSAGRQAKNDPIDAAMICWFAETFAIAAPPAHDADRERVDQLMTARRQLVRLASQLAQLGEHQGPRLVATARRAIGKAITTQRAKLEAAIAAKIKANQDFAARAAIIDSVPGLGAQFRAGVIGWLPELGQLSRRPVSALAGVAPFDDDSGQHRGERHIKGGRREIRDLLYMATLSATRCNPVIKRYYQRLRGKGKPAKVALVACMRKLLAILNTLLARGQMWNPPPVATVPVA